MSILRKLLEVPDSSNCACLLKQMDDVLKEYKLVFSTKNTIYMPLAQNRLRKRFESLQNYRKNFIFSEKEKVIYADLVIRFNDCLAVNKVLDGVYNDTNQSLLGEYT